MKNKVIKMFNEKTNHIKEIKVKGPIYLLIAFILVVVNLFLNSGILYIAGFICIIVGSIKSIREKNFKIMYGTIWILYAILITSYAIIIGSIFIEVQGIIDSGLKTGAELAKMSPEEIASMLSNITLYKVCAGIFALTLIGLSINLLYNYKTGRKREIKKYIKQGYEIQEEN